MDFIRAYVRVLDFAQLSGQLVVAYSVMFITQKELDEVVRLLHERCSHCSVIKIHESDSEVIHIPLSCISRPGQRTNPSLHELPIPLLAKQPSFISGPHYLPS